MQITNIETIKAIPGGMGYTVSDLGIVRDPNGVPCIQRINQGYLTVRCYLNERIDSYRVHRLVMETFLPNDNSSELQVNHKNQQRHDNRLENLEWVTPKDNINHGLITSGSSINFPIDLWNVVTDERISLTCARDVKYIDKINVSWETVLRWSYLSNDIVHTDGWRVKPSEDKWLEIDELKLNPATFSTRSRQPLMAKDFIEDKVYIFSSQRQAHLHTGVCEAVISKELKHKKQKVVLDRWVFKDLNAPWREFSSLQEEIKYNDATRRPVIVFHKDGREVIYNSAIEASRELNVGKTTISYSASVNLNRDKENIKFTKYGVAFKYL